MLNLGVYKQCHIMFDSGEVPMSQFSTAMHPEEEHVDTQASQLLVWLRGTGCN